MILPLRFRLLALWIGVLMLVPIGALGAAPTRAADRTPPPGDYSQDHVVVKMAKGARTQALGAGAEQVGRGWVSVPTPPGVDPSEFAATLASNPAVEVATVDHVFRLTASPPFTPNDPWWVGTSSNPNGQWHMHRIDLPQAWEQTVGTGVKVAVIDTGVTNGSLDGFCRPLVDEVDVVFGSSGPGTGRDWEGHGSHVAGTVAQCGGNGKWGTGVAPDASIMPINAFIGETTTALDVAMGIYWAIDHGAKVINMSLGFEGTSQPVVDAAIAEAVGAGVVLVASSGNTPTAVYYPANHPLVVGVGAVGFDNLVTGYSARGSGLDLMAPGGTESARVWQESPVVSTSGYVGGAGTSMAAPHVSGVVALLRSRYPTSTVTQVREAMQCTALDLGDSGWDGLYGWGLVQAGDALYQLGTMVANGWDSCVELPDGATKLATVGVADARWRLLSGTKVVKSFSYGRPGDLPFMGDWDGDGVDTPGLYRQSDGFVYLRNSNSPGWADIEFFFGRGGDIPVVGDFDGDGKDTVSVYRPTTGKFYIKNKLSDGWADDEFVFGRPGDVPVAGDWDGDGTDTVGLRRPSNGFVYLTNSNQSGWAEVEFFYRKAGDLVFTGDWDADGDDTVGVYRPSNGTVYLRNSLSSGSAHVQFFVGAGIKPAAGDF